MSNQPEAQQSPIVLFPLLDSVFLFYSFEVVPANAGSRVSVPFLEQLPSSARMWNLWIARSPLTPQSVRRGLLQRRHFVQRNLLALKERGGFIQDIFPSTAE